MVGGQGGQLPTQFLKNRRRGRRQRRATLLLAHPVSGSHLRPCNVWTAKHLAQVSCTELTLYVEVVRMAKVVWKLEKKGDLYKLNRSKFYDRFHTLTYKRTVLLTHIQDGRTEGSCNLLELSCCKNWKKKSQPRNWVGENGMSKGSEWSYFYKWLRGHLI